MSNTKANKLATLTASSGPSAVKRERSAKAQANNAQTQSDAKLLARGFVPQKRTPALDAKLNAAVKRFKADYYGVNESSPNRFAMLVSASMGYRNHVEARQQATDVQRLLGKPIGGAMTFADIESDSYQRRNKSTGAFAALYRAYAQKDGSYKLLQLNKTDAANAARWTGNKPAAVSKGGQPKAPASKVGKAKLAAKLKAAATDTTRRASVPTVLPKMTADQLAAHNASVAKVKTEGPTA